MKSLKRALEDQDKKEKIRLKLKTHSHKTIYSIIMELKTKGIII